MNLLDRVVLSSLLIGLTAGASAELTAVPQTRVLEPIIPARAMLIGEGFAGSSVNVVANRRHALFTHDQEQFAAFYDADGFMVFGHRRLGSERWRTHRTAYRGVVADAHNSISIAVDGDGYLHVAWDHHGNGLNYARSTRPLSLELGEKRAMTGAGEARLTYPELYRLPDGDLLCLYRDGASGDGTLVVNRYFTQRQQWVRIHDALVDGEGARNAYWGATVDRNGGLHLAWLWRETPDVSTNHDLAYAFSADGGKSWRSVEGKALEVPFTQSSSPYAVRIGTHRNLMNAPWVAADARGRPYIVSYWSADRGEPPQFRVVRHDATRWRTEQITQRSQTFTLSGTATRRPPISRGVFFVEGSQEDPPAHLIYRDDARGGRAILLSTANLGSGKWQERALTESSLGAWEPVIDPTQWGRSRQVHLLAQRVSQRDGEDAEAIAQAAPVYLLTVRP